MTYPGGCVLEGRPLEQECLPVYIGGISGKHHSDSLTIHLSGATASPSAHSFWGSKLESMETSTMGMSVNSSPNMSRKGTKTP